MALAKVYTGTVVGLDSIPITVEINVENRGLPAFNIVGLPSKAVDESKLRIRSAIINSKYIFPDHKITVNLAPANIPKEGSLYDLPIAIGILKATEQITSNLNKKLFMGELSLDGGIKKIRGSAVIGELIDKKRFKHMYIPIENKLEVAHLNKSITRTPKTLNELIKHLEGIKIIPKAQSKNTKKEVKHEILLEDIQEQEHAKRGMLIAAAGNHNIAMTGPPGTGKSMIAKAMKSILPELSEEEKNEVLRIKSIVENVNSRNIQRPFRSPHHTISKVGLIGGGSKIKPGEITLAHRGILFMDEFNEYPRNVIEALRQPLEDRKVVISRASGTLEFPASFSLVVANNPCPCGYLNSNIKECTCRISDIRRYQKRVSGPLWDRIDIYVSMKEFKLSKMELDRSRKKGYGKKTKKAREIVEKVRKIQRERYKNETYKTNAEQSNKSILKYINFDKGAKESLDQAVDSLDISPRGYFKILRVARTLADIYSSEKVDEEHIAEAINYRNNTQNNF